MVNTADNAYSSVISSSRTHKKLDFVRWEEGDAMKIIHMTPPTMWVRRTVERVRVIMRRTRVRVDWEMLCRAREKR